MLCAIQIWNMSRLLVAGDSLVLGPNPCTVASNVQIFMMYYSCFKSSSETEIYFVFIHAGNTGSLSRWAL